MVRVPASWTTASEKGAKFQGQDREEGKRQRRGVRGEKEGEAEEIKKKKKAEI